MQMQVYMLLSRYCFYPAVDVLAQGLFLYILVKFTVPFFPNTFLYTLYVLNVTIFCIWIFCLHTDVLCSV